MLVGGPGGLESTRQGIGRNLSLRIEMSACALNRLLCRCLLPPLSTHTSPLLCCPRACAVCTPTPTSRAAALWRSLPRT